MEAIGKRKIRGGEEFDLLFPRPVGKRVLISKDAGVEDTLKLMLEKLPKTLDDTAAVAKVLKGKSLYETCRNIWQFVYEHIPYNPDEEGIEQVRRPARTWHSRNTPNDKGEVGVDCDCYSEFIASVLMNLKIPFVFRIAMYQRRDGKPPYWQHIYVIVPKDGNTEHVQKRSDYIVLDCVKDGFDEEQPYLKIKDYSYTMKLEYLNGLEGAEESYELPSLVDARDMAGDEENEEELGKLGKWLKKAVKNVGDAAGKGIRAVNRFANPVTQSTRNGLLLAAKLNMMNLGGRLKYAYLTDEQAKEKGILPDKLAHLRKVKDSIENIYWQMGGKKENFKKAILKGKGNKNHEVPMAGLEGVDSYADEDEKRILNDINGLGDLGIGLDTAAGAVGDGGIITTVIATIKKLGNIFGGGSNSSQEASDYDKDNTENTSTAADINNAIANSGNSDTGTDDETATTTTSANTSAVARSRKPADTADAGNSSGAMQTQDNSDQPEDKKSTLDWVKDNPGKTALIGAGVATVVGGTLMYLHARKEAQKLPVKIKGLNGTVQSKPAKRKYKKKVKKKKGGHKKHSNTILI